MKIHLHKNATTTPAQRAFIQNNPHLSVAFLAEKTGVSKTTVRRWRNRSDVFDRPHTPKQIKTVLTPIEEIKVVLCRLATRAGLDDLNKIAESFLDIRCSRASLNRCLQRYHISRMPSLKRVVPVDLTDYTGTYLNYTCFHLPQFSQGKAPIQIHTLLDCTFKTFHAEISAPGQHFLSQQIRKFPLKVLGIIYTDPIVLVPESFPTHTQWANPDLESLSRSASLKAYHMDIQFPKTVQKLKKTLFPLVKKEAQVSWNFPWSSYAGFKRYISRYNTQFPLGALKRKTPHEALETHYLNFPNSFRQNPRTLAAGL